MGKLILNSSEITGYKVKKIIEESNLEVVILEIQSENFIVKYRICSDDREPNIDTIKSDLDNALQQTKASDLEVNEFLERSYIFITFPSGESKQYTASKIDD